MKEIWMRVGMTVEVTNEEYVGLLTLQIFINDNVVVCKQVSEYDLF